MKNKKIAKLLTRKDVRERYTREEAKQLFNGVLINPLKITHILILKKKLKRK